MIFQQDGSSSLLYDTKPSKFPFESTSEYSDSFDMILVIEALSLSSSSSRLSHGSYFSGRFEIRPVCNILLSSKQTSGKSPTKMLYLCKALHCRETSKPRSNPKVSLSFSSILICSNLIDSNQILSFEYFLPEMYGIFLRLDFRFFVFL